MEFSFTFVVWSIFHAGFQYALSLSTTLIPSLTPCHEREWRKVADYHLWISISLLATTFLSDPYSFFCPQVTFGYCHSKPHNLTDRAFPVVFGYFSDHYPSRRTPYILGLLLTGTATLLFALGTSIPILLAARILEGLSTGVVATVGSALLRDIVGTDRLGRAMGYTSMAVSTALLLGPVVGGVLYELVGYVQTFLPAIGLVVVEMVLRLMIIEGGAARGNDKEEPPEQGGDHNGSEYFAENTSLEVETGGGRDDTKADHTPEGLPTQPHTPTEGADSEPLLAPTPSTPAPNRSPQNTYYLLLTSPRFTLILLTLLVLTSIANGFDATLVPYLSSMSLSPISAATLFLALALPMLGAPLSGYLADAYGSKVVILAGLATAVPSLSALALIRKDTTRPMPKLFVLFMLIGTALALCLTPLRVEVARVVGRIEVKQPGCFGEKGAYARAFGLANGMVAAGGMVGPLVAGFLRSRIGWDGMAFSMGGIVAASAVGVLIVMEGRKPETSKV